MTASQKELVGRVGLRVGQLRTSLGLSQADFSERVGIAQSFISAIERGKSKASVELVVGIKLAWPSLSLDWLLVGAGEPWAQGGPHSSPLREHSSLSGDDEPGLERLEVLGRRGSSLPLWRMAMALLGRSPEPMTVEELREAASFRGQPVEEDEWQADLALMLEQGMVVEVAPDRFAAPALSEMKSLDLPNVAQLGITATTTLVDTILPQAETDPQGLRARVVTATMRVPAGRGSTHLVDLWNTMREKWEAAASDEGVDEELVMVLGLATLRPEEVGD